MKALGIDKYRSIVVLTGAGVSVASGLRPYRGPGGLWEEAGVAELATPKALAERPGDVWRLFGAVRTQARAAEQSRTQRTAPSRPSRPGSVPMRSSP